MKLYDEIAVDFSYKDKKGKLLQLVHEGYNQVNVITTNAGEERGGHYHANTEEAFYIISGSVEITMFKGDEKVVRLFGEDDFWVIHPYVVHEMKFPEKCLMVALYTNPVERDDGTKDIIIVEE